jgi:hypothetical protein
MCRSRSVGEDIMPFSQYLQHTRHVSTEQHKGTVHERREAVLGHDERVALSDYTQKRVVVVVIPATNGCEYVYNVYICMYKLCWQKIGEGVTLHIGPGSGRRP